MAFGIVAPLGFRNNLGAFDKFSVTIPASSSAGSNRRRNQSDGRKSKYQSHLKSPWRRVADSEIGLFPNIALADSTRCVLDSRAWKLLKLGRTGYPRSTEYGRSQLSSRERKVLLDSSLWP